MGILEHYTRAHPQLIKSTGALASDQEFPVMRTLFNITEPLVQGIEQIRLLFPGFPSLQGPASYLRHYRDFRTRAHQRLAAADVLDALAEQATTVEKTFLQPDLDITSRAGTIEAVSDLVSALQTPGSLIDDDFAFVFDRVEGLYAQLEKAHPEAAANLCLEFRIGAENDLDRINAARAQLIGMLQRGEQHFRSLYEEQMRRMGPARSKVPPGMPGPRN